MAMVLPQAMKESILPFSYRKITGFQSTKQLQPLDTEGYVFFTWIIYWIDLQHNFIE